MFLAKIIFTPAAFLLAKARPCSNKWRYDFCLLRLQIEYLHESPMSLHMRRIYFNSIVHTVFIIDFLITHRVTMKTFWSILLCILILLKRQKHREIIVKYDYVRSYVLQLSYRAVHTYTVYQEEVDIPNLLPIYRVFIPVERNHGTMLYLYAPQYCANTQYTIDISHSIELFRRIKANKVL